MAIHSNPCVKHHVPRRHFIEKLAKTARFFFALRESLNFSLVSLLCLNFCWENKKKKIRKVCCILYVYLHNTISIRIFFRFFYRNIYDREPEIFWWNETSIFLRRKQGKINRRLKLVVRCFQRFLESFHPLNVALIPPRELSNIDLNYYFLPKV